MCIYYTLPAVSVSLFFFFAGDSKKQYAVVAYCERASRKQNSNNMKQGGRYPGILLHHDD